MAAVVQQPARLWHFCWCWWCCYQGGGGGGGGVVVAAAAARRRRPAAAADDADADAHDMYRATSYVARTKPRCVQATSQCQTMTVSNLGFERQGLRNAKECTDRMWFCAPRCIIVDEPLHVDRHTVLTGLLFIKTVMMTRKKLLTMLVGSYIHRSYMYHATSNFAWTEPSSVQATSTCLPQPTHRHQLMAIHVTLSSPPTANANKSTNSRTTWPKA